MKRATFTKKVLNTPLLAAGMNEPSWREARCHRRDEIEKQSNTFECPAACGGDHYFLELIPASRLDA